MEHYGVVMLSLSPDASLGLMAAGAAAVTLEFVRPGWVIPAVAGCLLIVFGAHSLAQYTLSASGVALMVAGALLCGGDGYWQAQGLAGLAGAAAMFLGCLRLVVEPPISWPVAMLTSLPLAALLTFLTRIAWRARRNKRIAIF